MDYQVRALGFFFREEGVCGTERINRREEKNSDVPSAFLIT